MYPCEHLSVSVVLRLLSSFVPSERVELPIIRFVFWGFSIKLRRYIVCMMGHDPMASTFTEWHSTNWATYTMLSRMLDLNQPQVGYEPTLIPDHTGVEESSGNDPQSVSHRSHCLANKSRRLQGLLSIVFTTGYDPITSDVSDRRSTNWATWTYADQAGLEPTIP